MKHLPHVFAIAILSGHLNFTWADDGPPTSQESPSVATCDDLESAATAAKTAVDRAHAYLILSRCRLVDECASPLSAELCWTAKPDPALRDIIAKSKNSLEAAEAAIKELPDSTEPATSRQLSDRFDLLSAFAELFGALADFDEKSESTRSRLIDSCVAVSTYLDDPNSGIAESAKLWQSVAYRRAGRPDRALQLLWPAIGELSSNRVDFYARIERCRALADKGQFVAAVSLAMKIETHVDEFMKNENDDARKLAGESVRWVRVLIHRRWADSLRSQGKNERAKSAEETAAKLLGDVPYPPESRRWLQLDQTIVGLPEWKLGKTATSQKADDKS